MKLWGAFFVFLSGCGIGAAYLLEQQRKRNSGRALLRQLYRMETAVRFDRVPLPRLLEAFAAEPAESARFFRAAAEALRLRPDASLAAAFAAALPQLPAELREPMRQLGEELDGDEESVLKGIRRSVETLERIGRQLEESRRGKERLFCGVCLSAACLLILLLI